MKRFSIIFFIYFYQLCPRDRFGSADLGGCQVSSGALSLAILLTYSLQDHFGHLYISLI
jgi:hypothetical protein